MNTSLLKNEPGGMRARLAVSLVGHSAVLVAVLLCSTSRRSFSPEVIPISVVTISDAEDLGRPLPFNPGIGSGSVRSKSKPALSMLQAEDAQTLVVAKLTEASLKESQSLVPQIWHPLGDNPGAIAADQGARVEPEVGSVADPVQPVAIPQTYLWNTAQTAPANGGGIMSFTEERNGEPPGLTVTRSTDWQANPVEDDKLTYSAPGSSLKFTAREAYASGLAGSALAPGFGMQDNENSGPFGLSSLPLGAAAMARSQKVDWTIVNLENFGVTAFGYQNEIGSDFKSFGQTNNEFATPGSSTIKAGGEVRVGPFGFGFAQSSRGQLAQYGFAETGANLAAVGQEASVTLNLAHVLPGTQESGLLTKLLPSLWLATGNEHTPTSGKEAVPSDTVITSFGGTWTWGIGQGTLGYWDYSSAGHDGVGGSAWSGRGLDGSFGVYYASFGIDANLSYGSSEDVAPAWQSAGALYSYSVTVSYKPENLPGIWASAAAGNYNQNAIASGVMASILPNMSTSSNSYGVSTTDTNGKYWDIEAGLDVTSLFWTPDASASGALTGQGPSFKLLYRYSNGLYLDSASRTTGNVDNLVAVMIQRTF